MHLALFMHLASLEMISNPFMPRWKTREFKFAEVKMAQHLVFPCWNPEGDNESPINHVSLE